MLQLYGGVEVLHSKEPVCDVEKWCLYEKSRVDQRYRDVNFSMRQLGEYCKGDARHTAYEKQKGQSENKCKLAAIFNPA